MKGRDHYSTLGVSPDSNDAEIRSAYRTLAKKYHPDAGQGSSAEKFRDIQIAYDVLSDPVGRAAYDQARFADAGWSGGEPVPVWSPSERGSPMRPEHIDLRSLSLQRGAVRFRSVLRPRPSADPWTDLFSWFFEDFPF